MNICYKYFSRRSNGFTLTELIVTITIITILVLIVVPIFYNQLFHVRVVAHNANVATLRSAALLAIAENGNPEVAISWLDNDGTIDIGFDPEHFIDDWPELPKGLPYSPGFLGGSITSYQVQIDSGGTIEISPAKIT